MARWYTTKEAYRKLGISQPTLYRWITEARVAGYGDKVEVQVGMDGRARYYSLAQLRWLAARNGRDVLSDEAVFSYQEPLQDEGDLQKKVERLERRMGSMQQQVHELQAKVQEAYSFSVQQVGQALAELYRVQGMQGPSLAQSALPFSSLPDDLDTTVEALSQLMHPATATTTSQSSAVPTVKRFERSSNRHPSSGRKEEWHSWTMTELFAEGWNDPVEGPLVSRSRMAKAHHIPETNLRRDIEKRHVLEMINQHFLFNGSWRTGAFNAAQRRRVWEEYHTLFFFRPCEICLQNEHQEE